MTDTTKTIRRELLQLHDVRCGYATRPVLNGVNFTLYEGENVLLAGPNGCGKSTLLKAVVGMLPLTSGSIAFDGCLHKYKAVEKIINSGIGYLRQNKNIFPGLTVRENLELSGLSMSKTALLLALEHMLTIFDFLRNKLDCRAGALSGGQRQALAIAMVLLHERKLYLLDEPTAGLSPKAAADIIERIHQFSSASSTQSVLMVEHRLELLSWVDRAVIMIQGKLKAETTDASRFLDSAWLEEHYF